VSEYEKILLKKRDERKNIFQNNVKQYVNNHIRFEIITKNQKDS
jgi:hypothetical protein